MSSTLGAALFYAQEKGWPVLPVWPVTFVGDEPRCRCGSATCKSIGKHPIATYNGKSVAPKGVIDATVDATTIRNWWALVPDANLGIKGSVFFALDVDDHDGLQELTEAYGKLPDTVESISGSGGRHILFKQPDGDILGNEEGSLPDGINVRGNRGYIVVAPSMHKSGSRYEWEVSSHPRDVELADAPQWLLDLIGKPTERVEIKHIKCSGDVPSLESLQVASSIKELIRTGVSEGDDRSSEDQRVIVALLSNEYTPGEIKAIFSAYPIGTQGKYAERGDEYLDRSITNGMTYVGPKIKSGVSSVIVPGKLVSQLEAGYEKLALDTAYLAGWNDALSGKTEMIKKLWPNHVGVNESSIALYGLGLRMDMSVDETDSEYAALVVPYNNHGELANVGYDLYQQPAGTPGQIWEEPAATHIFETDNDARLAGSVLVADGWDVAVETYLAHGLSLAPIEIVGLPQLASQQENEQAVVELARLLENCERILLAWPSKRQLAGELLAQLLDKGNERVYWLDMPGTMREMYTKYGMTAQHLNRYIKQASTI